MTTLARRCRRYVRAVLQSVRRRLRDDRRALRLAEPRIRHANALEVTAERRVAATYILAGPAQAAVRGNGDQIVRDLAELGEVERPVGAVLIVDASLSARRSSKR